MKKFKRTSITTLILCIIPLLMGIYYYHELSNVLATHFNFQGTANGFMTKGNAVITMPIVCFWIDLMIIIFTNHVIKKNNLESIKFGSLLYIVPLISIVVTASIIFYNLGYPVNNNIMAVLIIGIMFIILGNFIPTVSYQFEKKMHPFYRGSEADWNQLRRVTGKWFFFGGILMLLAIMISANLSLIIMVVILVAVVFVAIKSSLKK
ncbi:DUF1648 domain-containing protein [Fructilactobacillus sp. Tb1]|uniref:DUF1648 domain-containing protein n=1 Tax=Fructilactobacillus sp. Tb1 TaxID=3422304 RepID=UPI003D27A99E